ncbi:hypothetical protein [Deminuibacter soli]|uniref:TolB N-terminal domain-containing protein n=1 Tax=Deminuibacter soli TaxID=2291815 RepID=A0A3E1NEY7_9BACT|nr:hypothetical protein [Deminuibacter soli]RFM26364.1 hypothetical protein DXN05_20875 [Deminuibacter soli]
MRNLYPSASFSDQQIFTQLHKVLLFHEFTASKVLSAFLHFIVEEKIAGRGNDLKEYTIAVKGLGRTSSFNPQHEAVIRIYALRLRKTLQAYYNSDGKHDNIRISVPKGSYIPHFEPNMPPHIAASPIQPMIHATNTPIAVFPFLDISPNNAHRYLIDDLCEQISTDLSCSSRFAVISYFSARKCAQQTADLRDAGLQLGANMIITGSVRFKLDYYYLNVQLVSAGNGIQLWAQRFEQHRNENSVNTMAGMVTRELSRFIYTGYSVIN